MPNLRKCRVTVKDIEGVVHAVDVTAETLNEAVGQAVALFRRDEWASALPEAGEVHVEVRQPPVEHSINLKDFWRWLDASSKSPRDLMLKGRVRGLLK